MRSGKRNEKDKAKKTNPEPENVLNNLCFSLGGALIHHLFFIFFYFFCLNQTVGLVLGIGQGQASPLLLILTQTYTTFVLCTLVYAAPKHSYILVTFSITNPQ